MPVWWHVRLSRRVNGWCGGNSDEMFCSRLFRERSHLVPIVDAFFRVIRAERHHCLHIYEYEQVRRADMQIGRLRYWEGQND
jgi:hypothetical protein